jgi:hypothetical protein
MLVPVCIDIVSGINFRMTFINATRVGITGVAPARMKSVGICTVENYVQKLLSKMYQLYRIFR